jgi:hypothetical protein
MNHGWIRTNTDKGTSGEKRFGDEINYVKERSAERVSRSSGDVYCIIIHYYDMSTKKFKNYKISRNKHLNPGWTTATMATN